MRDYEVIVNGDCNRTVCSEAEIEVEWKELHRRLRALARQRVTLEAEEASLLLEAEESQLHKRLGYASLLEYMERELHYGPHAANERLRVARELLSLPLINEQFRAGELSFSAVRELTRVATPDNEHLFLTKAHGKTARDVERMVAGLKRGDDPEAEPDPRLIKKRISLEVSAETFARYRMMRTAIDKSREERITDDELLAMLLDAPVSNDEVTPPRVHVAMNTCKVCKTSAISVDGEQLPIDDKTAEVLACDSIFIGDLESDDLTRPKAHIPDAMRRKVMQRDGYACVVPGCRSKRNLSVHHLRHRQHGGQHTCTNLCTLCDGHHLQHHDGRLIITGEAPDLTFRWITDDGVATVTNAPPLEYIVDHDDLPTPLGDNAVPRGITLCDGVPANSAGAVDSSVTHSEFSICAVASTSGTPHASSSSDNRTASSNRRVLFPDSTTESPASTTGAVASNLIHVDFAKPTTVTQGTEVPRTSPEPPCPC